MCSEMVCVCARVCACVHVLQRCIVGDVGLSVVRRE